MTRRWTPAGRGTGGGGSSTPAHHPHARRRRAAGGHRDRREDRLAAVRHARLTAALASLDQDFAIARVDNRTGRRYDYRGEHSFEAASVVKVELLAALLLRAASFAGERTALKNGWLSRSSDGGRWSVNSTGRISGEKTGVAISVPSHGHGGQPAGIRAVERIATLTRGRLGW